MGYKCPCCSGNGRVNGSFTIKGRAAPVSCVRRRLRCARCGHRWSVWEGAFRPPCPKCSSKSRVLEVRRARTTGAIRRRMICTNELCEHRWTQQLDPSPEAAAAAPKRLLASEVTEEMIRVVLTRRDLSNKEVGDLVGMSKNAARDIRVGNTRKNALPDLPRWGKFATRDRKGKPIPDADIIFVLTRRDLNHVDAARQIGSSREAVRQIRAGLLRATVAPEIPRWTKTEETAILCTDCEHWGSPRHPCKLGLPDPEIEGLSFAADCSAFVRSS
jgi:hypothetical protein